MATEEDIKDDGRIEDAMIKYWSKTCWDCPIWYNGCEECREDESDD